MNPIDQIATGKKLRRQRRMADCSMAQVAAEMGVSRAYIGLLETGKRAWSRALIREYKSALEWAISINKITAEKA